MSSPAEFSVSLGGEGEEVVVEVRGELDVATSPDLRATLHPVAVAGPPRVVVDLSGVSFIDSTGIGVLVTALKQVRARGGQMVLRSPQPMVRKVLAITGLDRVFTIT